MDRFRVGCMTAMGLRKLGVDIPMEDKSTFVSFPLFDMWGDPVGFHFREFGSRRTYTCKLRGFSFFGLDRDAVRSLFDTGTAVLVEGPFDFFPVQRAAPNTLCLLTANLFKGNLVTLRRLVTSVYLFLDLDGAGRRATRKLCEMGGHPSFHSLGDYQVKGPRVKDPSDLWKTIGDEGLRSFLHDRVPALKRMEGRDDTGSQVQAD